MYNAGLILEGGGMRGVYTCGVIDCFLDNNIEFSSLYGVSAGAGHACSYLSKQRGRAFHANTDFLKGYDYAGLKTLLKTGSLFNMDFIYETIPNELMHLDSETFNNSPTAFYAVVTSCESGEAEYIRMTDYKTQMNVIKASGSLPALAPAVEIDGRMYYDGGVSDSIPLAKSISDGNTKNIVVLTRDKSYRKSKEYVPAFFRLRYGKKYPNIIKALDRRHIVYNRTLELIDKEEREGRAIVIRPKKKVEVKRADTDIKRLTALYNDGYNDAKEAIEKFDNFFG